MGTRPVRSILPFERAEYLGRRAGVRYSRSLVARRTGLIPAASKIRRADWDQEIGMAPPMWNRPEISASTRSMVRAASSGAKVGEATWFLTTRTGFGEAARRSINSTK